MNLQQRNRDITNYPINGQTKAQRVRAFAPKTMETKGNVGLERRCNQLVNPNDQRECLAWVISHDNHKTEPQFTYYNEIMSYVRYQQDQDRIVKATIRPLQRSQNEDFYRRRALKFLFSVGKNLKLARETIHFTIYLYDLHLETFKPSNNDEYNLTLMACLHISNKFNQIYYPTLDEITQHYSVEKICNKQAQILLKIDFKLNRFDALCYLDMWYSILEVQKDIKDLGYYILNTILFDRDIWRTDPQHIALAVLQQVGKTVDIKLKFAADYPVTKEQTDTIVQEVLKAFRRCHVLSNFVEDYMPEILRNQLFEFL